MAVQLFNLRGVPDDEAEDIRRLLADRGIDIFETPPGNWGISIPALWLKDEGRLEEARALINTYQARRAARVRREHQRLAEDGKSRTLLDEARERPGRLLLYGAIIALVLYVSTKPFLGLGG